MNFIKLAVTTYQTGSTRPQIGADDTWINLEQVVSVEERLGSNTFDEAVLAGSKTEEFYPCVLLHTTDSHSHLVPIGVYPDQGSAFQALVTFMPLVIATPATTRWDDPSAAGLV
ncbi:hypothetical protein QMG83_15085 [Salinibacterium sp. G-O1]|uniref:hypothetical protein n=1 Tax=Salinibacterium sp. G-O1 TaxID=3046208 RepID=UPI0024BBD3AD|nr:hypothetical protein [Salinibacterium sp. G-O1]MDJ0336551.1 hypothetical protein [Salinibacterium sp. G-O1]